MRCAHSHPARLLSEQVLREIEAAGRGRRAIGPRSRPSARPEPSERRALQHPDLALLGAEFFILPAGNGCIVGRLAGYGARVQEPS